MYASEKDWAAQHQQGAMCMTVGAERWSMERKICPQQKRKCRLLFADVRNTGANVVTQL